VSPGDRKGFVEKTVFLLTREGERERISGNAAKLVADQYSWETITDRYEELLIEIAKNN